MNPISFTRRAMNRRDFMGAAAAVPVAAALPLAENEELEMTYGPGVYKSDVVQQSFGKPSEDSTIYFQFGDGERIEFGRLPDQPSVGERVSFVLEAGGSFTFTDGKGNSFTLGLGEKEKYNG
jgi:hypothetical protein